MNTLATALRYYRQTKPQARRTAATAIIHSGGKQTIYQCVCGSVHTCSTQWRGRNSRHVQAWRIDHEDCILAWIPLGLA